MLYRAVQGKHNFKQCAAGEELGGEHYNSLIEFAENVLERLQDKNQENFTESVIVMSGEQQTIWKFPYGQFGEKMKDRYTQSPSAQYVYC